MTEHETTEALGPSPQRPPPPPAWRRWTRRWQRAAKRQRYALFAEAAHDVRDRGRMRPRFVCEGIRPHVAWHSRRPRMPYGWVKLSFAFGTDSAHPVRLRLCMDLGIGFSDADAVWLPVARPCGVHRITAYLFFPPELRRLGLDLDIPRSVGFDLHAICAQEITKHEALAHALWGAVRQRSVPWRQVPGKAANLLGSLRNVGVGGTLQRLARRGRKTSQDYAHWVDRYDTLSAADVRAMQRHVDRLVQAPTISVIMPVYNASEHDLRAAIASVRGQIYPHWQLCMADDASTNPHVASLLAAAAQQDPRIHVVTRTAQGHICAATNTALTAASGEFVAFLDHDDVLRPHALYMVAIAVAERDDVGLVYSDEDKITADGQRYDPYFKPDFNFDLLRGQNYINHLTCIRRRLVEEVGGLREGFEGAQDYDLVLRVTQRLRPEQIRHIPHVLYHWRAIMGSTAHTPTAKPYIFAAAQRALQEDVGRRHIEACVSVRPDGFFKTTYAVAKPSPHVSIIIPTRDRIDLMRQCIDSIVAHTTYAAYDIIIVDNDSVQPESLRYLAEVSLRPNVSVLPHPGTFNYAAINNAAVRRATGTVVCLLNNDIEITTGAWLGELMGHAMRPEVGAVGAKLLYPDHTVQHAGVVLGMGIAGHAYKYFPADHPGSFSRAQLVQQYAAVTGACLAVRRSTYLDVGGLDEALRVAYNDVDFCLRLWRAGYRNVWTPYAQMLHHESASRGADVTAAQRARARAESDLMQTRWGDLIANDPFYSPNLSLQSEDYSLAMPPRASRPWLAYVQATHGRAASQPPADLE